MIFPYIANYKLNEKVEGFNSNFVFRLVNPPLFQLGQFEFQNLACLIMVQEICSGCLPIIEKSIFLPPLHLEKTRVERLKFRRFLVSITYTNRRNAARSGWSQCGIPS